MVLGHFTAIYQLWFSLLPLSLKLYLYKCVIKMVYTTIPLCLSNFNTLPMIFSIIKFHLLASDIFCFFITPGTDSIVVSAGKSL